MKPQTPREAERPGVPRWVKVLGAIAILLAVAFVVLHFVGLSPAGH
jgi:hypothetical protein